MGPATIDGLLNLSAQKPQETNPLSIQGQTQEEGSQFKDSLNLAIHGVQGNDTKVQPTLKDIELQLKELGLDKHLIQSIMSLFEKLEEQIEQLDANEIQYIAHGLFHVESLAQGLNGVNSLTAESGDSEASLSIWNRFNQLVLSATKDEQAFREFQSDPLAQLNKLIQDIGRGQQDQGELKQSQQNSQPLISKALHAFTDEKLVQQVQQQAKQNEKQHALNLSQGGLNVASQEVDHSQKIITKIDLKQLQEGHDAHKAELGNLKSSQEGQAGLKPQRAANQENPDLQAKLTVRSEGEASLKHELKPTDSKVQQPSSALEAVVRKVVLSKMVEETEQKVQDGGKLQRALEKLVQQTQPTRQINGGTPEGNALNLNQSIAASQKVLPSLQEQVAKSTPIQQTELIEQELDLETGEIKVKSQNLRPQPTPKIFQAYGLPQQAPLQIQSTQVTELKDFSLQELAPIDKVHEERVPNESTGQLKAVDVLPDKTIVETQTSQDSSIEESKNAVKSKYGQELVEKFLNSTRESLKLWVSKKLVGMQIQIDPPELGKIQLKTAIENGKIGVSIHAETSVAKELLSVHLQDMKNILKEQGLDVANFHIEADLNDQKNQALYEQKQNSAKFNLKSLLHEEDADSLHADESPESQNYFDRVA